MKFKLNYPSWIPTLFVVVLVYALVAIGANRGWITPWVYGVIQTVALTAISALGLNLIYGFNGQFSLGHIGFYAIGAYCSALITKDFLINWSGTRIGPLAWVIAGIAGAVVALVASSKLRFGSLRKRLTAGLSSYLKPYEAWLVVALVSIALIAVIAALGIGVALGLHFVLSVLFSNTLLVAPQQTVEGIVFLLALLTGASLAALVAYVVGLPLLRLSSDYFGIATLGFAIMVYTALQSSDMVIPTMKGARGMVEIPFWTTWAWVLGGLVVVVIVMRNLIYSSYGRAIIAVREDEIAAKTMGIDVVQAKTIAFTFGGFFAGLAGGFYAHLYKFLVPSNFDFIKGFDPLIIIVFGGLGSMTGTILASALYIGVTEGFRVALPQGFEAWRFVIFPIILVLTMLLRKQGLLGTTEWGWLRAPTPPAVKPATAAEPSVRELAVGRGEDK